MKPSTLILCSLVSLTVFPGWECGEPILDDPGFDLWCGEQLCSWEVPMGAVRRVSTWHRSDSGVELVGDPVVLTQLSDVTSAASICFLFELQADTDDGVNLTLEMDFLDDGSVEYSHALPSDDWQQVQYKVATPVWYEGVRFTVRKSGAGRAVLGTLRVTKAGDCPGPALELVDRPLGALCDGAGDCSSGHCEEVNQWGALKTRTCSGCGDDTDCAKGQACGVEAGTTLKLFLECGASARHQLGERCVGDGECATGVCCDGLCSQCCRDKSPGCVGGTYCNKVPWSELDPAYQAVLLPWQCSPGQGLGVAGDPCLWDVDCASGSCGGTGELRVCILDGRRCQQDSDCPAWLTEGLCLPLGQLGGACQ